MKRRLNPMNKKNLKNTIMAGSLVGVLAISGAFAYLTDSDTATNKFTVGDVTIDLQEPTWEAYPDENDNDIPDIAEDIWAGKVITKDPKIVNTGDNESYVYLEVTVPKAAVITTDDQGNVLADGAAVYQDLFTYEVNEGWTLLETVESNADDADGSGKGTVTRLYAYDTALAAETGATGTLFDEVTFVNLKDNHDQIPTDVAQDIVINAYAIQSNFGADGDDDQLTAAEAWELYATQNQVVIGE
jgi:predicted ribosomally synthesized peptide with SipW-like signal peptide